MSNEQTIECENPVCNCQIVVVIGSANTYCSSYCRIDDEDNEQGGCSCTHPPCDIA